MRLQKVVRLKSNAQVSLFANVFNLLNDDSYQGVDCTISSDDSYKRPSIFNEPRRTILGAKLAF